MSTHSGKSHSPNPSLHSKLAVREYSKEDVMDKYEVVDVLGEGSIGSVWKVRIQPNKVGGSAFNPKKGKGLFALLRMKKKTKDEKAAELKLTENSQDLTYALKSIQLSRVNETFLEELENEIDILRNLDHPNVVRAYEIYKSTFQIYLVLELCDGGDLYSRSPYTERQAAYHTECILSAIRYMHSRGVVHRDLKYENIMFSSKAPDATIKVIDFGLSRKFMGKTGFMTERVGTIYTMAPEVIQGMYSAQADLWSIGVVAFMLLSATKPFYDKRRRVVMDLIIHAHYDFSAPTWATVSDDAKDFCKQLLVIDPNKRLNPERALKHPWIVNREQLSDELPSEEALEKIRFNLCKFVHTSHLKKLALTVIAYRSTQQDINRLRTAFEKYDTENDGVLTFDEFKAALESMNYPEDMLREIFDSVDLDQNGQIMWTEFLAATIEAQGLIAEERIAEAFDRLDSDGSGFLESDNIREFLGQECTPKQVEELISVVDTDKDGKISYPEFLAAFREQWCPEANKNIRSLEE